MFEIFLAAGSYDAEASGLQEPLLFAYCFLACFPSIEGLLRQTGQSALQPLQVEDKL
jgi:hypothetical protein